MPIIIDLTISYSTHGTWRSINVKGSRPMTHLQNIMAGGGGGGGSWTEIRYIRYAYLE